MKGYKAKLGLILILISVLLSLDNVAAKTIGPASVDIKTYENDGTVAESDMPEGGWSPMVGYRLEEDIITKEQSIKSFRRIFNAPLNDVFAEGVGTNGYNALPNDNQKVFYTKINSAAVEFMESTDDLRPTQIGDEYVYIVMQLDYNSLGITQDEAFQTLYAYDYDHPAYYWIGNRYFFSNTTIFVCTEEEYASVSNRKNINNQIIDGVNKYVAMADKTDDVFEKIALVHDGIIADIDYAYEDDGKTPVDEKWAHSVQGVFDSNYGHAVCEGYSDAFSLIMNYLGIPNYYIVGHTAKGGGHAWNAVSDDGGATFMYMDLTWDDLGKDKGVFYKYFGMPSSNFEQNHIANSPSDTGVRWLYDINANLTNDFENTYYYKAGFYCSASDDCKKFAKLARIRAYRFGTVFSYLTDDMTVMSKVASEFNLNGQYVYYEIDYLDKEYYLVVVSKINDIDLSSAEIVLKNNKFAYTGEEVKPEVDKVVLEGIKLIKDDNYTVSYDNNIEVGTNTANVIVKGAGHFTGQCSKNFSIVYEIKDENVIFSATEFTYDGTDKKPVVTVEVGNKTLVENTNYTVAFSDNTTDVGTVTVTVEGIGEYEGTVEKNYTIEPASIADYSVSIEDGNWIYDGTPKEPQVISLKNENVVIGADNYIVTYENNVNAGDAAKIIVTGCGNYTGEISDISYTILPKEVAVTGITAWDKIYDGTTDVTLDYSGIDMNECGIVDGDKVLVTAEGSFIDAEAGKGKKVLISNINLTGEAAGNYKLSALGQQNEASADISPKHVTITAVDQAVYLNADIDKVVSRAILKDALENHELTAVEFVSSGTDSVTDRGSITPVNAIIKSADNNVTANYDITYVAGNLTVVKKEAVVTYSWSDDGKECYAKAVYPFGEVVDENAAVNSKISKEATCKDKGVTTYTASFTDELFTTQAKDICDIDVITTHTPALAVKEKEVSETCTLNGSYDEVVYCSVCGAELDRNNVVIDAIGHQWGEWAVVIPATQTSDGLEERICNNDSSHKETRIIEKIESAAEPDGDDSKSTDPTQTTGDGTVETSEETPNMTPGNGTDTTTVKTPEITSEKMPVLAPEKTDNDNETFTIVASESGELALEYMPTPENKEKTIIIPDEKTINGVTYKVTGIADGAFANNKDVNKIVIGENIESIGENAFANCSSLTKVIIPAKVRRIKKNAFRNNKKLKTVIIKSKKLKSIGKNAFKNINKKATFYVPKKLTKKQYTKYKKMLNKSGISKSVKIKKK